MHPGWQMGGELMRSAVQTPPSAPVMVNKNVAATSLALSGCRHKASGTRRSKKSFTEVGMEPQRAIVAGKGRLSMSAFGCGLFGIALRHFVRVAIDLLERRTRDGQRPVANVLGDGGTRSHHRALAHAHRRDQLRV
jgi:hypothetical protein